MASSVYKVIELVGTSTESWEEAARAAVERASQSLRDLRIAEVVEFDMQITDGKDEAYRAKVKVSFKFEENQEPAMLMKSRGQSSLAAFGLPLMLLDSRTQNKERTDDEERRRSQAVYNSDRCARFCARPA